ncbi:MAG: hypothetical protein IPG45_20165 [Deltaproteobacteria bacterium]|jgi:hypothetical protein|nr:hypothetical protein [Deltaproteobacteria bacterium]
MRWAAIVVLWLSGCFLGLEDQPPVGPPGPAALIESAQAYDPIRGRLVVQGGREPEANEVRSATWEHDGQRWVLTDPIGPGPRRLAAMVHFPELGAIVLYGGSDADNDQAECNETWTYDGAKWRRLDLDGPGCRRGHNLSYDPDGKRVLLFGGLDFCGDGRCQETWAFDGQAWTLLARPGE